MSRKWSNHEVQQAVRDLIGTDTYDNVAKLLSRRFGKEFTGEGLRKWYKRNNLVQMDGNVYWLRNYPNVEENLDEIYRRSLSYTKIGVISDLHIPQHDEVFIIKATNHIIESGCDVIVIAGDALDQNKFTDYSDNNIPFAHEYEVLKNYITSFNKKIDIILIKGNHEYRLENYLHNKTKLEEYSFLFRNGVPDPLWAISQDTGCQYSQHWWAQIGPIIVSHPSRYTSAKQIGKNIVNSIDYFSTRIRDRYWDTLVQGHSHQANHGIYNGINYFENGCCCHRMDYNTGPRQTQPVWTQAYSILVVNGGKLDRNNSHLYTGQMFL